MTRSFLPLIAAGFVGIASPSFAADCLATLTGQWITKGDVDMGIAKVKVDNHDSYNADGSFKAIRRFVNQDGKWETQTSSGKWSAKPGGRANECVIEMSSTSEFGSSSSSSTVTLVNRDTFRSFGVDAKRVK